MPPWDFRLKAGQELVGAADILIMRNLIGKFTSASSEERELRSPLQRLLNRVLFDMQSPLGRNANLLGILVILGSVLLSMVATIPSIDEGSRNLIHRIEIAVTLLFAAEYILRIYASRWPARYILSFYGMIDLLTWLPLLLLGEVFLAIRLLRVLRLLKLLRYLRAMQLFFASMLDVFDVIFVVLATILIIVLISGNLIYYLEPETFPNAYIGCWWSLVTMTTVGYGDMVPVTVAGKIEAAVLMLTGVTMFALLTGTVSIKLAEMLNNRNACHACGQSVSQRARFCQHCGEAQNETSS